MLKQVKLAQQSVKQPRNQNHTIDFERTRTASRRLRKPDVEQFTQRFVTNSQGKLTTDLSGLFLPADIKHV